MVSDADAIILRVSSHVAACLESTLAPGRPFGLEVVGDPYEVFSPGSIGHPLRPFLRWWFTRTMKRECGKAAAVAYVTAGALQERYQANGDAFKTSYSSIELLEEAFAAAPRQWERPPCPIRIIAVGSMEQMYKGFDVLIDAVGRCLRKGLDLELELVGDGRFRSTLEGHVRVHGIERKVTFAGRVSSGAAIREHLDRAHLFVLPSKTEGLPRAMVEAMAWGLPCIGSAVGGIPELLSPEDLVDRGDVVALANKIVEVVSQPGRLARMSETNLARARNFHDSVLRPKRRLFLEHVHKTTEEWIRGRGRYARN
jgi:glycosyltransferase involved in cell wall biosynthesis